MNFASKWKETENILLSEVTQKGNVLCSLLWEAPRYKSSDEITYHGVIAESSRVKWDHFSYRLLGSNREGISGYVIWLGKWAK